MIDASSSQIPYFLLEHVEAGGGVYGGRKGQRVPGIKYGSRQGDVGHAICMDILLHEPLLPNQGWSNEPYISIYNYIHIYKGYQSDYDGSK